MLEQTKRFPYLSDLSDKEWEIIVPYITEPERIEIESAFIPLDKY